MLVAIYRFFQIINQIIKKAISPIIVICIILLLWKYFSMFHHGFSDKADVWGQFGDFINPLISLLALVALITTYRWQVNMSSYQIFESVFFKILDLHNNKAELLYDNLQTLIDEYNKNCRFFTRQLYQSNYSETLIPYIEKAFKFDQYTINIIQSGRLNINLEADRVKFFEEMDKSKHPYIDPNELNNLFTNLTDKEKNKIYKQASNQLYDTHGNGYGHYFRNMNMMFDHLNNYNNSENELKFAKMYRAQLSKNEVVLLFINNHGKLVGQKFLDNCIKYKMFDDFNKSSIVGEPDPYWEKNRSTYDD